MNCGRSWWWGMAPLLAILALAWGGLLGCYSHEARSADRLKDKVEEFHLEKGRMPTTEEIAVLQKEADEEERAIRKAELEEAKKQAVEAGGAALSGNFVGAGVLALGAFLTWLGVGRAEEKKKPKAPAPTTPVASAQSGGEVKL